MAASSGQRRGVGVREGVSVSVLRSSEERGTCPGRDAEDERSSAIRAWVDCGPRPRRARAWGHRLQPQRSGLAIGVWGAGGHGRYSSFKLNTNSDCKNTPSTLISRRVDGR